jgi:hypothetical protein
VRVPQDCAPHWTREAAGHAITLILHSTLPYRYRVVGTTSIPLEFRPRRNTQRIVLVERRMISSGCHLREANEKVRTHHAVGRLSRSITTGESIMIENVDQRVVHKGRGPMRRTSERASPFVPSGSPSTTRQAELASGRAAAPGHHLEISARGLASAHLRGAWLIAANAPVARGG